MAKRKGLSKKLRFEIFKRDGFTCQYCGEKAPNVVLHVDHIAPIAKGGTNDILNLVTSCQECNSGKGARELNDNAVVTKQLDQLSELHERKEQLEMLVDWREMLRGIADEELDVVIAEVEMHQPGYSVSEHGRSDLSKLIKRYGFKIVIDAVDGTAESYLKEIDTQSLNKFWEMLPRVALWASKGGMSDVDKRLFYIRGIMRNRFNYINEATVMPMLRSAVSEGFDVEDLADIAKSATSWTNFNNKLYGRD